MGLLSLIFKIGADATGFKVGMKQAENQAQIAGKKIAGFIAGAFSVAAIARMTKSTMDYASAMHDMAERAGVSVEAIQELNYAAKLSSTSIEAVVGAMKRLSLARAAALDGGKSQGEAFAALGIGMNQLNSQSIEETFKQIAQKIRELGPTSERGVILNALLGRGGEQLIPMFNAGLREMGDEAQRTGAIMKKALVDDLEAAQDEIDKLQMRWTVFFGQVIGGARLMWKEVLTNQGNEERNAQVKVSEEMNKATMRRQISIANRIQKDYSAKNNLNMHWDEAMRLASVEMSTVKPTKPGSSSVGTTFTESMQTRQAGQGSLAHVGGFFGLGGTKDASVSYLKRIERNTSRAAKAAEDLMEEGL
jgi:hypothetical protein